MKKQFLFAMAFVTTFVMGACSSDFEEYSDLNETYANEVSGEMLGKNLMSSFDNPITRSTDIKERSYPDYYGGAYLKANGTFVVNVKNDTPDVREDLIRRCKGSEFETRIVEYSYNDLMSIAYKLDDYILNNKEEVAVLKFYGFDVIDETNKIVIRLGDISEDNIKSFATKVMHAPCLEYIKSEPMIAQAGTIYSGQSLYYVSWGSVGFRAKRSGVEGFVTAGHVAKAVGVEVFANTTDLSGIGMVEVTQTSGDMDAAFCSAINGYTPSNQLYDEFFSLTPSLATYYSGSTVYLNGRNNNSSGTISSLEATITTDGVTLTGMIRANYTSAAGDSGGVIYSSDSEIAGTHIGSDGTYRFFQPASRTVERYGLQLY